MQNVGPRSPSYVAMAVVMMSVGCSSNAGNSSKAAHTTDATSVTAAPQTFQIASALYQTRLMDTLNTPSGWSLTITSAPMTCAQLLDPNYMEDASTVEVDIDLNGTGPATFALGDPNLPAGSGDAAGWFDPNTPLESASGSVTVSNVSAQGPLMVSGAHIVWADGTKTNLPAFTATYCQQSLGQFSSFAAGSGLFNAVDANTTVVYLFSQAITCAQYQDPNFVLDASGYEVDITLSGSTPGAYPVSLSDASAASFVQDTFESDGFVVTGLGGTVNITALDANTITGNLSASWDNGQSLSVSSFTATVCDF